MNKIKTFLIFISSILLVLSILNNFKETIVLSSISLVILLITFIPFAKYLISIKYNTLQKVNDEDTRELVFSIGTKKAYLKEYILNKDHKEKVICAAVKNKLGLIYVMHDSYDHSWLLSVVTDNYSKTQNYIKGYLTNKGNFVLNKKIK